MAMKKYRFVGLDKDVWLPDNIVVEIAIVPEWRRNIRSNERFTGQTSYTQHETANFNAGANATMHKNWLHNGAGGDYVGFNFAVDDKRIIQLTPLNEVTWAAGTAEGNRFSYHTELCVNSDINHSVARRNAAALAGGILAAKGWDTSKLHQHNIWWGKDCPYLLRRDGRWPVWTAQVNGFRLGALDAYKGGTGSVVVPVSTLVKGDQAEVVVDALNIRQGPGKTFKIVAGAKRGEKVEIIDGPRTADGTLWFDIKGSFGTGWAAETDGTIACLKEVAPPAPQVFDGTKTMTINGVVMNASKRTVTSIGVNEREWASTDSPVRKLHANGTKVAVIGWLKGADVGGENRWWITNPDGGRLWVGGTIEKP